MKVDEMVELYRLYGFEKEYVSEMGSYVVFSYGSLYGVEETFFQTFLS